MRTQLFSKVKKLVVKVGTSILTEDGNQLSVSAINNIAEQISYALKDNKKVVLVTSGAIGAGMGLLGIESRPRSLPDQQAVAAIGQSRLMRLYDESFKKRGLLTAQILLTREDLRDRVRYLNARNTLMTLLGHGVVPIVNENDTVAVDEIKFGDNDTLSSLVANLIGADLLIILSDIDGLYTKNPAQGEKANLVSLVKKITPEIEKMADGTAMRGAANVSVGGMATKIEAAKIATHAGISLVIANGREKDIILRIVKGEDIGTLFLSSPDKLVAKKHWIAYTSKSRGKIIVDTGAMDALIHRGRSLLSSGIMDLEGSFEQGDMVTIEESGTEFARGLINYSSSELKRIKGAKTRQIEGILGYKYYDEVIHRDNLVIL